MPLSSVIGSSSIMQPGVCTSSTRPASPYDGQVIYETDTDKTLVWNGTGWVFLSTSRANPGGLDLIKTQTIGSAVSSVTVTDAFSSTYENYKIIVSGGLASASVGLDMQLGSTTTGYYGVYIYSPFNATTVTGFNTNNGSLWGGVGATTADGHRLNLDLLNPFLTKRTSYNGALQNDGTNAGTITGYVNNTTSYTGFTLTTTSGTITGGTIRVYGYVNS
jgi:hypothetical protein